MSTCPLNKTDIKSAFWEIFHFFVNLFSKFKLQKASDSSNEGLNKSFKENVGSVLKLSAKRLFSLDKYRLNLWGENSVFAIQHTD